jgi:DNA-binding transcriptional ArsR family regulator
MAGFRYVLQPVLERYIALESAARARVLAARAHRKCELGALRALERDIEQHLSRNFAALRAGVPASAGELAELERRQVNLESTLRRVIVRVDAAGRDVEQAEAELDRATRKRKKIERHREGRLVAYRAERARREEAELDDGNALLPGCAPSLTK